MNRIICRVSLVIACVASIGFASVANAEIAYQVRADTDGNQSYAGALGMDFTVNFAININQMGVFDDSSDGLVNTLTSYIYDRTNGVVVGGTETMFTNASQGNLIGGSRFKSITPVMLGPGEYSIVSYGYSASDQNGNSGGGDPAPAWTTSDGGGLLSFTGDARYGTDPLAFPGTIDGGPSNRYAAGTFDFSAVPEPTSLLMFGVALVGFARRRRS